MIKLDNEVKINRHITFSKCGHSQNMEFIVTNDEELINCLKIETQGINDYCSKCNLINTEYGMAKEVKFGDFEMCGNVLIFNHTDIKKVVRYCWEMQIPLHDERYHINSMYDCTGECHSQYVKVRRGKKVITVTLKRYYDL